MTTPTAPLAALTRIAAGDWDGAHALVDGDPSPQAAWVHAHLHRIEGDHANARYWYAQAGKPVARGDFDEERRAIEAALAGEGAGGP
jgi:hypothetical protein